jgi:hypothetical protein
MAIYYAQFTNDADQGDGIVSYIDALVLHIQRVEHDLRVWYVPNTVDHLLDC